MPANWFMTDLSSADTIFRLVPKKLIVSASPTIESAFTGNIVSSGNWITSFISAIYWRVRLLLERLWSILLNSLCRFFCWISNCAMAASDSTLYESDTSVPLSAITSSRYFATLAIWRYLESSFESCASLAIKALQSHSESPRINSSILNLMLPITVPRFRSVHPFSWST